MQVSISLSPPERLALEFLARRERLTIGQVVERTLRETLDLAGYAQDALSYLGVAPGLYDAGQPCPQCDQATRADPDRPGARFCDACQEPVLFSPEDNTE